MRWLRSPFAALVRFFTSSLTQHFYAMSCRICATHRVCAAAEMLTSALHSTRQGSDKPRRIKIGQSLLRSKRLGWLITAQLLMNLGRCHSLGTQFAQRRVASAF